MGNGDSCDGFHSGRNLSLRAHRRQHSIQWRLHKCHCRGNNRSKPLEQNVLIARTHSDEEKHVRHSDGCGAYGAWWSVISRATIIISSPERKNALLERREPLSGGIWLYVPSENGCITRNARPVLGGHQRELESQLVTNTTTTTTTFRACFFLRARGINRWAKPGSLSQSTV